jgi:exosortase
MQVAFSFQHFSVSAFQHFQPLPVFPLSLTPMLSASVPRKALIFPLCVLATYWAVLIYYLGAQWSVYEQYSYGWAVPFLCAYLLWRRLAQVSQTASRDGIPAGADTASVEGEGRGKREEEGGQRPDLPLPSSIFYLLLALCALLYAPTRFFHEANPIWRLTSYLWTLEVIGLTLLFLWTTGSGPRTTFPICFFLVAVPWPSGLENLLTQSLMRLNVATGVELLDLFGIPAIRHGNVIEISTGVVGIDEACSGIRSFQATLMLALFFGEVYRLTARRRLGLVLLGCGLAFVFNVGRTLLLTSVASARGIGAVAAWHDPAGITILVGCFLSLWLVARGFRKTENRKQKAEIGTAGPETEGPHSEVRGPWSVVRGQTPKSHPPSSTFYPRWLPATLLAWLLLVEGGIELWYQYHEHAPIAARQWSLNLENMGPDFTRLRIPSAIAGQFWADEGTNARWRDNTGRSWELYYFRWLPAHSLKRRVEAQLAKTHGPEMCLPAVGMKLKSYLGVTSVPVAGMDLAVQHFLFNADGRPLNVFYGIYEDPSGSDTLAYRRKNWASRVAAAFAGSRNYGQRYFEVAAFDYERPEDATAAFANEVQKLIKIDN